MALFTPEIAEYALRLRESFPARAPEEEVLVDTMVSAAIRLKILYNDPRALDPFDPLWTRTHTATLRAFFRAHDTLTRRRRTPGSQPNRPEPPPPDPSTESRTNRASTSPPQKPTPAPPTPSTANTNASPTPVPSGVSASPPPQSTSPNRPVAKSATPSTRAEPTFDDLLRRPRPRDLRNRKIRLIENHVIQQGLDRFVPAPISATPPRASP